MTEIWSEEELKNMINGQVEENLHLDYKAADSLGKSDGKKKEISKDVSAFANSDGGVIIYGIKEYDDPTKRHLPENIDPINRVEFTKEWLEQIINSNIYPRINGVIIYPIKINNSDDIVYRVVIPKSLTAHQAKDLKYYKRFNFESIPMYDYEIKDILNRATQPIMKIEFVIEKITYQRNIILPSLTTGKPDIATDYKLNVIGNNSGNMLANYVNAFICIPYKIANPKIYKNAEIKDINGVEYIEIYCDNTTRDLVEFTGGSQKYGPSRYEPILPKVKSNLKSIALKDDFELVDHCIIWTVYADNSIPQEGEIKFSDIEIKITDRTK